MAIPAGLLQKKITIQEASSTLDNFHQPVSSWVNKYTCRARIQSLTGRDLANAQMYVSEATHTITIRHPRTTYTVKAKTRVAYGSRVFRIEAALNLEEQGVELTLICVEVT